MAKEVKGEVRLPKPVRAFFLIKNPISEAPVSKLEMSEQAKKEMANEWASKQLKNIQEVEVLSVGPDVTAFKAGDNVKIKTARFMQGEAILDGKYFIHSEADVIAVY